VKDVAGVLGLMKQADSAGGGKLDADDGVAVEASEGVEEELAMDAGAVVVVDLAKGMGEEDERAKL
jgi:hypothetical protein